MISFWSICCFFLIKSGTKIVLTHGKYDFVSIRLRYFSKIDKQGGPNKVRGLGKTFGNW